jgi:hypothetical protein
MTSTKFSVVYECDVRWDKDSEEVFVFMPTVNFKASNGHTFGVSLETWNQMGKPQKVKVTLEAVDG